RLLIGLANGILLTYSQLYIQDKYARARTALRWLRPYAADLGEAEAQDIQDGPRSDAAGKGIFASSGIYIFGYSGLLASYAWLSGDEMPLQRLRSLAFGVAMAVARHPTLSPPHQLNWRPKNG
ncbi:MAG: hypothetical protein STHCBS139747_002015, partial [Sporothrix thermara]